MYIYIYTVERKKRINKKYLNKYLSFFENEGITINSTSIQISLESHGFLSRCKMKNRNGRLLVNSWFWNIYKYNIYMVIYHLLNPSPLPFHAMFHSIFFENSKYKLKKLHESKDYLWFKTFNKFLPDHASAGPSGPGP